MKKLILLLALIASTVTAQAQRQGGYHGYRVFVEIGHIIGHQSISSEDGYNVDKFDYSNTFSLSTTHGYQFSSHVFLGVGGGVQRWKASWSRHDSDFGTYVYGNDDSSFTRWYSFVEARFDFPILSRVSFFETNKIGVVGGKRFDTKLYFAPAVGAKYQLNYSFALNLSLGYQLGQKATRRQWLGGVNHYNLPFRGPTLSIGIDFQP